MGENPFKDCTDGWVAAHNARVAASKPRLARQINDPQTGQVDIYAPAADTDAVPEGQEIEQLHNPILKWCKDQHPQVPHYHARPDRESGVTKGAPDLCLFYKRHVLLIECKTRAGKLSEDQRNWAHLAGLQGFKVEIVRSMKRFDELIEEIDHGE